MRLSSCRCRTPLQQQEAAHAALGELDMTIYSTTAIVVRIIQLTPHFPNPPSHPRTVQPCGPIWPGPTLPSTHTRTLCLCECGALSNYVPKAPSSSVTARLTRSAQVPLRQICGSYRRGHGVGVVVLPGVGSEEVPVKLCPDKLQDEPNLHQASYSQLQRHRHAMTRMRFVPRV